MLFLQKCEYAKKNLVVVVVAVFILSETQKKAVVGRAFLKNFFFLGKKMQPINFAHSLKNVFTYLR